MLICCLAMAGGILVVAASVPEGGFPADRIWLALPLIGCTALHFALHRTTGRCALPAHGKSYKDGEKSDA
jgi:hypothetical protein